MLGIGVPGKTGSKTNLKEPLQWPEAGCSREAGISQRSSALKRRGTRRPQMPIVATKKPLVRKIIVIPGIFDIGVSSSVSGLERHEAPSCLSSFTELFVRFAANDCLHEKAKSREAIGQRGRLGC